MPQPLLLDTDIGSDIDDLMALLYVLGSPAEVELVGISTAYGDTALRALIAAKILRWTDTDVPITTGPNEALSGRPIWYAGYEDEQAASQAESNGFRTVAMGQFFENVVVPRRGDLSVLAIAPLTNLASPPFASGLADGFFKDIAVMGGNFGRELRAEHNMISDAVAAAHVLSSATPTTVIGTDQTLRIRLSRDSIHAVTSGLSPIAKFTRNEVDRWMATNGTDYILLHDPLAAATITHPKEFTTATGRANVTTSGIGEGTTTFTRDPNGTNKVVVDFDTAAIEQLILDRIESGLRLGG